MDKKRKELLIKMLKREAELRLSPEKQYEMAHSFDWMDVVANIQIQVVKEFNLPLDLGLSFLRSSWSAYPHDPEIEAVAHWIKYNRAKKANLEGKNVFNQHSSLTVYTLNEEPVSLLRPKGVQVILGSSYS